MNIREIFSGLRVRKFKNRIFHICEGQSQTHGFPFTPLHVNAVTDSSNLSGQKYLKIQKSKNSHLYNLPASLSPALDNMKFVTELMVGLCT